MQSTRSGSEQEPPLQDFRSKATFGVAMAAIFLLLPVGIYDIATGERAIGFGTLAVVFVLSANARMVWKGICHQALTAYGLIPAGMIFMTSIFRMDGIIASLWCYPIVLATYCMLSEQRAWLANLVVLGVALPMAWLTLDTGYALRVTTSLCAVSLFAAIMVNVIDEQRRQLEEQLTLDPLTGLLNRLTFNTCMDQVISLHRQNLQPVSLLAIDIDFFKQLNDTHGHAAGDHVLGKVGILLRKTLREEDAIFRMGGEEFTVVLKCANQMAASQTAERVRAAIANASFGSIGTITISIGVAEYRRGESWENWAKRADDNLYEAKNRGRNRVVLNTARTDADIEVAEKQAACLDYQWRPS